MASTPSRSCLAWVVPAVAFQEAGSFQAQAQHLQASQALARQRHRTAHRRRQKHPKLHGEHVIAPVTVRQSSDCRSVGVNIVFFDWDGVVVDSQELIHEAYTAAGVNPPDNVLAQEGGVWLENQVPSMYERTLVRMRKDEYYMQHIADVPSLAGHEVAWHMSNSPQAQPQRAFIVSGAPAATGLWLQRGITSLFDAMLFGVRTPEKMRTFKQLAANGVDATYVDDQDKFIDLPEGWSFVHYTKEMESGALCRRVFASHS